MCITIIGVHPPLNRFHTNITCVTCSHSAVPSYVKGCVLCMERNCISGLYCTLLLAPSRPLSQGLCVVLTNTLFHTLQGCDACPIVAVVCEADTAYNVYIGALYICLVTPLIYEGCVKNRACKLDITLSVRIGMFYCAMPGGGMGLRVLSYTYDHVGVFAGARPCVCMWCVSSCDCFCMMYKLLVGAIPLHAIPTPCDPPAF